MTVLQFAREIGGQYPMRIIAIVLLLLVATVLEMIGLTLAIPIIGNFLGASGFAGGVAEKVLKPIGMADVEMSYLLAAFLLLMAARTIMMFICNYAVGRIAIRIEKEMKCSLLESLLRARWSYHVSQDIGSISNVISRESQSTGVAVRYLGRYVSSIVIAAILFVTSGAVSWEALLLALALAVPMILIAHRINVLSRKVAIARVETNGKAVGQIIETANLMKMLKASSTESEALDRFEGTANKLARLQLKNTIYESALNVLPEFFSAVAAVFLIVLGYYFLDRPPADIVLFSLLIYRAFNKLGNLQSQRRALISYIPGYEACRRVLHASRAAAEALPKGKPSVNRLTEGIELRRVDYRYPESDAVVLNSLSMTIGQGAFVGLVGHSGSGKTTIVDLIAGLLTPTAGEILIDGRNLAELDVRSWRRRIAYVPQDPTLFNGTIRDNILRDAGESRETALERACRLAHVREFTDELPDGLNTWVGDRGARFSGGQRQRIAIARALMRDPDLLIFDEATSALDSESELYIRHTLAQLKGNMTIVAIAHRYSAIRDTDVIFVLKNGEIVESGSFETLSEARGEFSQALADAAQRIDDAMLEVRG